MTGENGATKSDLDKLNRKFSEIIRTQKNMAIDIELQNRMLKEMSEMMVAFMSQF